MEKSRIVKEVERLEEENKELQEALGELFEKDLEEKLLEVDNSLDFSSPLNFAKSLIEHTTHVDGLVYESETLCFDIPEHDRVTFDFCELEEIAEYLLVYCKHNKGELA